MKELNKEELVRFSEQLVSPFILEIEGYSIQSSLLDLPLEVRTVPMPTAEDVGNVEEKKIKNNEIYFYTPSLKSAVFNLLRHFRNCAVHKGRIKQVERNGTSFYYFEDKTTAYTSMRGYIAVDKWDDYIKTLYQIAIGSKKKKTKKEQNN